MGGWSHPSTEGHFYLLSVSISLLLGILANAIPIVSLNLSHTWYLGLSGGSPRSPPPLLLISFCSPGPLDFYLSFPIPGPAIHFFLPIPSPFQVFPSFLLSFIWSLSYIMGSLSFWTNIHLLVSTYHVCPLGFGLPHLGYFIVLSICLQSLR